MRRRAAAKKVVTIEFNPNSIDAQFATIHTELSAQSEDRKLRMDTQDNLLRDIKAQTTLTNGRVTILEFRWKNLAKWMAAAATAATVLAELVVNIIGHFWK